MEEEIDKLSTWADENVQPEDTDDKPEETPAKEEKPEEKPLEGEKDADEPPADEGDKPEDRKEGEGSIAKGFGVEGHTPKGVQERINELSRGRREDRETIAALKAEIETLKKGQPQPKEKDRNDFASDEEWVNYLAEKKATEMFNKNMQEWQFNREMAECQESIKVQEDEARKSLPDFDDVMARKVDLPVDQETYRYVMKSNKSAKIQYSLRKIESLRQQFINTPVEQRLNFIKGVEQRLVKIDEEVAAKQKSAPEQKPQNVPPAQPQGTMKQPMEVRRTQSTRPDPATCSMDEWMEYGD